SQPAPSSNAHTYRLLIVKDRCSALPCCVVAKRCVRQQQRSEIMRCFAFIVKPLFSFAVAAFKAAPASEEQDYNKSQDSSASVTFPTLDSLELLNCSI
ncbi:hypothetical protein, partial [Massilia sp. BKSP1R2A-1]|uniref:hypothetical protein n=1 Tax=Massilia sp. BKSP1R2A-1 TaxID=3422595 RepID=UPI003D357BE1